MNKFAVAAVMGVGVFADNHWSKLMVKVDSGYKEKYIQSQEWSEIPEDNDDYCASVPANNSFGIKDQDSEGASTWFKPYLRGGAMEYTVDLSTVDCGCVAGVYAVAINDYCNPEDTASDGRPSCPSIDIMNANPYGFNVAAHPCNGSDCSAASQCDYDMKVQGVQKYGDYAYGPNGEMINTNEAFTVKTEFVSTANYADLWMLRTRISQAGREMVLEADCRDYLKQLDVDIEGNMGYVFSTWDNRDGQGADFECPGECPEPASSCDGAVNALRDIKFYQWGYNEDPPEEESEDEEDEDPAPEPADFEGFIGEIDDYGTWEFFVKGLQGSQLETSGDSITMHENNKAFVLDHAYDDSVYWSYWHPYLGGSVEFDVDVSEVECGCAAGVYLARLDDEECSWDAYESGTTPQCGSIDLMEANIAGFRVQSQPCEFGTCDQVSQCQRHSNDLGNREFGPGSAYTIDSQKKFTVKTHFYTNEDETGEYTDVVSIKTCIEQGDNKITLEQDCGDYLDALSWQLDMHMAMGISVYEAGVHSPVSPTCTSTCAGTSPKSVISNIRWSKDDSVVDPKGDLVIGGVAQSLSDCQEDGCTECHNAWYEFVPEEVFATCTDYNVYKYGNECSDSGKWNRDLCNPGDMYCQKSYPWGDPDRHRSEGAACRTVPDSFVNGDFEYSLKECRKPTAGLCHSGCGDSECRNSWPRGDEFKWKSPAAICRCMPEGDD